MVSRCYDLIRSLKSRLIALLALLAFTPLPKVTQIKMHSMREGKYYLPESEVPFFGNKK